MNQKIQGIGMTSQRTRERLLQRLREKGIADERVLDAMRRVPRHLFVDEALASRAYEDSSLPIGFGQTISQPYTVARMTQALAQDPTVNKVLEVGTGSGYQTAVLAAIFSEVYTVERIEALWRKARSRLRELGAGNVQFKLSDGNWGWPEHAPFDAIIVTAAPTEVPPALLAQLSLAGRMIVPVGHGQQELLLITREPNGYVTERMDIVNFVPLIKDKT